MKKRYYIALYMIIPAMLILLILRLYPLIYTSLLSVQAWSLLKGGRPEFVGLANYIQLLSDQRFIVAMVNTLKYVIFCVPLEFIIGLIFALLLYRLTKGRNLITTMTLLPMIVTPVITGILWRMLYQDEVGLVNFILNKLGVSSINWLGDPSKAMMAVIVVDIWQWTPFMVLVLLAGLQSLPQDVFEVASIDGANVLQELFYIILPLLRPIILVALMMRGMDALRVFDTIFVMTEGGPGNATDVLSIMAYRSGFRYFEMGLTAATTIIFLLLIILLSIPYLVWKAKIDRSEVIS